MDAPANLVGRVAAVLRAVSEHEPDGVQTSHVARQAGLARPTAHRLLTAMLEEGLTDRTSEGRWLLGPDLFMLGAAASRRYDLSHVAQPIVRRLAATTGESAFYSARRGSETVCLIREDGSFPIRSHVLHEGIRFPLGVASAGLAILAHLPDDQIDDYLDNANLADEFVANHDSSTIRNRVKATRVTGYALNPGLIVTGSWGLGAAVFDARQQPIGALSITGIEHRFSPDRLIEIGPLLLRCAHELTKAVAAQGQRARAVASSRPGPRRHPCTLDSGPDERPRRVGPRT